MIMGQIGEYRELDPEERRQLAGIRAFAETLKEPEGERRNTKTLGGMLAEALGCLEDALWWLEQINEQYDVAKHFDKTCFTRSPLLDFWLQANNAEDVVKDILRKLRGIEPLVPKEEGTAL